MSLIQQIKRAAINHGIYKGEVDDNWEPADRLMFHRLCSRFHGNYTDHPTRANQSKEFLDWLDNYKDSEYSEEPYQHKVVNPGGIDLRQLIPDRQPVNTEGAASKQEIKQRDAMVNENVIKIPQSTTLAPDPKKVVQEENNELSNKESLRSNNPSGSETDNIDTALSRQAENEQAQSKDLGSSNESSTGSSQESNVSKETREPASALEPVRSSKPASIVANKPAPITGKNSSIKTR